MQPKPEGVICALRPSRAFGNISDWHPGEGGHGGAGQGRSRGGELHKIVQRVSVNRDKDLSDAYTVFI